MPFKKTGNMRESSLFPRISQVIQSGDNFINRRNMNSAPAAMCVSRCSACLHRSADRSENFQSSPKAIVKGPSLDFEM